MLPKISTTVLLQTQMERYYSNLSPSLTIGTVLKPYFRRIQSVSDDLTKVKVGLEATGHYSYNLLGFLLDKGLPTYVINPLHTNLYRKSLSLRKTKTDKVDSRTIATMMMSDVNLKSYSDTSYHNEELKSLTRYRFDKVKERAKLKSFCFKTCLYSFPGTGKTCSYASYGIRLLLCFLNFQVLHAVASAHLTRLSNLLSESSKGRYGKDTAVMFRDAARSSIGSHMPAKSLELKHTIKLIQELTSEIDEIEAAIKRIMDEEIQSPILTIPGISYRMGAMIIAEIGDFSRFDSADKILAYAGMSPSTYQSGQLDNCYAHMEKRGSRYLRYALYNATKYVCHWDESFGAYLEKKRSEGKHYNVALSHAAKKLVRLIFAMEKSGQAYHASSLILIL